MRQGVTTVIAGWPVVARFSVGVVMGGDRSVVVVRGIPIRGSKSAGRKRQMQQHQ